MTERRFAVQGRRLTPPPPAAGKGPAAPARRDRLDNLLVFSKNGPCEVQSGFHNPVAAWHLLVIPSRSVRPMRVVIGMVEGRSSTTSSDELLLGRWKLANPSQLFERKSMLQGQERGGEHRLCAPCRSPDPSFRHRQLP